MGTAGAGTKGNVERKPLFVDDLCPMENDTLHSKSANI